MGHLAEAALEAWLRHHARTRTAMAANASTHAETAEDYVEGQFASTARILDMYPDFNVAGKDVLEIGCGLGGRAAYVATLGPRTMLGVDINRAEIADANRICHARYPALDGVLEFRAVDEDESLGEASYDVALLVDAIEHVVSPVSVVRRAWECLRPGGVLYFSSIGWFSAYGSHTGMFPFVNVFFSDTSILNATRWQMTQPWYRPSRHDSEPPIARWEWLYDLSDRPGEHLNKITIAEIRRLLKCSKFSRTQLHLEGLGHGGLLRRTTNVLVKLPIMREVAHGYFVATCHK